MIIAMGLVNHENIQDYWSTPFFPQIMARDIFMNIFKTFFHWCDNDNYVPRGQAGPSNPVNNLGTVYSIVTKKFSSVWMPGKISALTRE